MPPDHPSGPPPKFHGERDNLDIRVNADFVAPGLEGHFAMN